MCETANFIVQYTKKQTGNALQGDEARELSARNCGADEWSVVAPAGWSVDF